MTFILPPLPRPMRPDVQIAPPSQPPGPVFVDPATGVHLTAQLPLPYQVSGVNSYPVPADPVTFTRVPPIVEPAPVGTPAAMLLPPLPALPPIRIYSGGKWVTPWYPMRVTPCADRAGLYEMQFSDQPEQLEYWDGKRWPGIAGRFTATAWRGLAYDPNEVTK